MMPHEKPDNKNENRCPRSEPEPEPSLEPGSETTFGQVPEIDSMPGPKPNSTTAELQETNQTSQNPQSLVTSAPPSSCPPTKRNTGNPESPPLKKASFSPQANH
jgi:hypothetical protein